MTDQHPFGEYVAALTRTTADLRRVSIVGRPITLRRSGVRVNLLDLPPRSDRSAEQIDLLSRPEPLSPSQMMFGVNGASRSVVPPREENR